MSSGEIDIARKQVAPDTPEAIVEAIAYQLGIISDARQRISGEGIVVRDLKGTVIAHPAIRIEAEAVKILSGLISKYCGGGNLF
jgi:hypothetical protein